MNFCGPIAPTELLDYAKSKGWVLLKEAIKDGLYVLSHPAYLRRQLVFPTDATAPDYAEAVTLMMERLVDLEGRPLQSVLHSLLAAA
jgi:hypothetical protein